ncbi:MAG: hypothetical protein K6F51_00675 [Acetatifactor sp.]|nr:hypothetical protein [Acetatifactor sp.]
MMLLFAGCTDEGNVPSGDGIHDVTLDAKAKGFGYAHEGVEHGMDKY